RHYMLASDRDDPTRQQHSFPTRRSSDLAGILTAHPADASRRWVWPPLPRTNWGEFSRSVAFSKLPSRLARAERSLDRSMKPKTYYGYYKQRKKGGASKNKGGIRL